MARSLLPELFKAAECLKIKGLAIPDEALAHDETNMAKSDVEGSPPRKRQKPDGPAPEAECMEIPMRNQHNQEGHHQSEYMPQQESRAYDLKVIQYSPAIVFIIVQLLEYYYYTVLFFDKS